MATLVEVQNNLLTVDIWGIIKGILIELSGNIIEMNKRQLIEGKMADGSGTPQHTGSPRSEAYVLGKIADGIYDSSIFPHYNYFNEGDFFLGFVAKMQTDFMEITSTDDKGGELVTEFGGASVFGLTDENLDFLIKMIIPTLNQRIREKLKI
jgi:hypothetical protein